MPVLKLNTCFFLVNFSFLSNFFHCKHFLKNHFHTFLRYINPLAFLYAHIVVPQLQTWKTFIMSINHAHMCSKSFLTCSHLWFFNYKQKIFTRKMKKQAHKYIFIRLSCACIRQNIWVNASPGCRLQDASMRAFINLRDEHTFPCTVKSVHRAGLARLWLRVPLSHPWKGGTDFPSAHQVSPYVTVKRKRSQCPAKYLTNKVIFIECVLF